MSAELTIAIWASNILENFADDGSIAPKDLPELSAQYQLTDFLVDNYELFHLYPDAAVFDEIRREIAEHSHD